MLLVEKEIQKARHAVLKGIKGTEFHTSEEHKLYWGRPGLRRGIGVSTEW